MADENVDANVTPDGSSDETSIDYKAKAEQLEAAYTALEQSNKGTQRENARLRTQTAEAAALTQEMRDMKTSVNALLEGDEEAQERVEGIRAKQTQQSASQTALTDMQTRALQYLTDAGVADEDDARYKDVSELWSAGDHQGAVDVARSYRQEAKRTPKESANTMPKDTDIEAQVEAIVEKRLRAAGLREVDKGSGGESGGKFKLENLETTLENMSPAEILENLREINEAQ